MNGDAKAFFHKQADLVGSCTVPNFTMILATMTAHIFPTYAPCDQKQYFKGY